mmetsp:Transcript_64173/g.96740  ORF Transcript_64173/g.96740 Transcript_64173/m.96740 type:complete len:968 (+) Transcript_64173:66-2969(+)|eukprot:CAMPEP_0117006586 /NCGR_PEP_ID=MMETSP0472-20121206/6760_1 /TAXON_ID=693140 ORGANISM="Tiarina fusus, Strain LIS" /NCGR_SAMPLE_ID=MMETSP0472 /ASSEMBLY_ACC=CAM_ASM_000603 /LENGTH=967 /DNA_ID=CAMNT_0004708091 /DNA_START=53 /DNA_END=2956 /DNA_ORIENTATION=+
MAMTKRRSKVKIVGMDSLPQSASVVHEALAVGISKALAAYKDYQKENVAPANPQKVISNSAKAILQDLNLMAPILVANDQSIDSAADVDPDEFMDYARAAIENNNKSYDPASFKDFESLLEESIHSHFLDDDDDQDSMTSASSFSGYSHEPHPKRCLKQNALISTVSASRLNGTIARRKSKDGSRLARGDGSASKGSSCKTSSTEDDCSHDESTIATGTSSRSNPKVMNVNPRAYLRRYDIKYDENSLVSDTSYQPDLIRRQRTRIRRRADRSMESEIGPENVEQTIDDLIFVLTQERVGGGDAASLAIDANNKDAILSSLKQKSPALYDVLLSRLENKDTSETNPIFASEFGNASQGDVNLSSHSTPLQRSFKMACSTPDKTYEADKSQLESTSEYDQAGLSAMDLKDAIYISEASLNHSPTISASESPSNSDNLAESSRRVSFSADSPTDAEHWKSVDDEFSVNTSGLNITIDSGNIFLPSIDEVENDLETIVESLESQDGWDLDEMIELFLNHKIETLKERMVQQEMAISKEDDLLTGLSGGSEASARQESLDTSESQSYRNSAGSAGSDHVRVCHSTEADQELHRINQSREPLKGFRSRSYWHARVRDSAETMSRQPIVHADLNVGESDTSAEQVDTLMENYTCVKGRELIRRIQSKRESIAKARKEKQDTLDEHRSAETSSVNVHSGQEVPRAGVPESSSVGSPGDEEYLENFLNRKPLQMDAKKRKLRNMRARRRSILRSQNSSGDEMLCPLHAPIDTADTLVPNVSLSSPMVVKKVPRFGRVRSDSSYEQLPEKENSFVRGDMDSEDMLQAFLPPSPQSPIRDYRQENLTDTDTSDALRSADIDFSDVKFESVISVTASADFSDSFDEIVLRTTPKNVARQWVEDSNGVSPTSVGGFFDVLEEPRAKHTTSTLAFVDEDEPDPVFVDDDDFIQDNSYQLESGIMTAFVEATFLTSNRFEV